MGETTGVPYDHTDGGRARALRRWLLTAAAAVIAAAITAGLATGDTSRGKGDDDGDEHGAYAIGLWGDLPYSDAQALTGVPNLIADMNSSDIEFSIHDGDFKAGNATAGSTTVTT